MVDPAGVGEHGGESPAERVWRVLPGWVVAAVVGFVFACLVLMIVLDDVSGAESAPWWRSPAIFVALFTGSQWAFRASIRDRWTRGTTWFVAGCALVFFALTVGISAWLAVTAAL